MNNRNTSSTTGGKKNDKKVTKTVEETPKKGGVKVSAKDAKQLIKVKSTKSDEKTTKPIEKMKTTTKQVKQTNDEPEKKQVGRPSSKTNPKNEDVEKITKPNRFANVEKGDAANKNTAYIHATFNVNKAKTALKNYINKTLELQLGQMNAHYPYTAIVEELVLHIIRASGKFNMMSAKKADLYNITLENIQRGMRESSEFGPEIKLLVDSFNKTAMDYIPTFFDTEKALRSFIETKAFTNTTNVHINNDALNFVCYILSHIMGNLTRCACSYSEYAKKNNVLIKNFRFACKLYFNGPIRELLIQRLSEIEALFASQKKSLGDEEGEEMEDVIDDEEDEDEEDDDEDDEEEDEEDVEDDD